MDGERSDVGYGEERKNDKVSWRDTLVCGVVGLGRKVRWRCATICNEMCVLQGKRMERIGQENLSTILLNRTDRDAIVLIVLL